MDLRIFAAIGTTLVFWASAFVGIRAGLSDYAPGHFALLRFVVACTMLGGYALATRMRLPDRKDVPALFLHGFLGFSVYHGCLNFGEMTVTAASACFLIVAIPIFTTILAVLFLGERMGRRAIAGIVVSVVGVAIISLGERGDMAFNWGVVLVLVAALSESVFMILQKPYLSRYSAKEYVTYTVFTGTFFLLVFSPGFVDAVVAAPMEATLAGVYLGIFPAAVAYVTWAYALARADVSRVVAAQYCLPALTLFIGWVWLGELPTALSLTGGLFALAGVVLITMPVAARPAPRVSHS